MMWLWMVTVATHNLKILSQLETLIITPHYKKKTVFGGLFFVNCFLFSKDIEIMSTFIGLSLNSSCNLAFRIEKRLIEKQE